MQSVRLAIEHTEETIHPMHAFVCESAAVERELLLEGRTDDGVRTLLFYVEGDAAAYEAALSDRAGPLDYDIRPADDDGFFLYVRAPEGNGEGASLLHEALDRETVVVVHPTEFRSDMTMVLTLVGGSDDLQGVVEALSSDLDVEVLTVGSSEHAVGPSVTERQREALAVAERLGYYDVPRENGIEAVAAELDCAVSTASALLRRAESRLVADALGTAW